MLLTIAVARKFALTDSAAAPTTIPTVPLAGQDGWGARASHDTTGELRRCSLRWRRFEFAAGFLSRYRASFRTYKDLRDERRIWLDWPTQTTATPVDSADRDPVSKGYLWFARKASNPEDPGCLLAGQFV